METRKLISLYKENYGNNVGKYYISFAFYGNGNLPVKSEEAYITEEELYKAVKPYLRKEMT